jgi:GntR family transcriptional regulator
VLAWLVLVFTPSHGEFKVLKLFDTEEQLQREPPVSDDSGGPRLLLREQVCQRLRQQILSGELPPHTRLPSEACLMKSFGVSRVTVRQGMRTLAGEGLIYSLQGRGSFVSAPRATYNLSALLGFHEAMRDMPFSATSRLLSCREVPANRSVATALKIKRDDKVLEVKRARCLNGLPVSLDLSYFPRDIGERLRGQNLDGDIFPLLETRGVRLGRSRLWIEACACPDEYAVDLSVSPGTPILQLSRLTLNPLGRPVDYEYLFCRGDAFQYKVELERHPY